MIKRLLMDPDPLKPDPTRLVDKLSGRVEIMHRHLVSRGVLDAKTGTARQGPKRSLDSLCTDSSTTPPPSQPSSMAPPTSPPLPPKKRDFEVSAVYGVQPEEPLPCHQSQRIKRKHLLHAPEDNPKGPSLLCDEQDVVENVDAALDDGVDHTDCKPSLWTQLFGGHPKSH